MLMSLVSFGTSLLCCN